MKVNKTVVLLVVPPLRTQPLLPPIPFNLEMAGNFAVLAGTTVHNTGETAVKGGDVGTSHGNEIIGFPPGKVRPPHTTRVSDAATRQAHVDLTAAYMVAKSRPATHDLSGQGLGGLTLLPGVYSFSKSATLDGTLTLNNQGDPDAKFIFQIGTTLTTSSGSAVITINGGPGPEAKSSVTWQVGTSATLGADSTFEGNILALNNITMEEDSSIHDGSALSQHGKITLDTNKITKRSGPTV